ncbi:MAG: VWA domain-containing protein [Marinobacter sp.]|uniref:VWA domain-containing protein n=1 Tax=Marinobacter sp. TaxID=50741 RepID=UPI0034A09AC0
MSEFHFLRPFWLLILLAIPLIPVIIRHARQGQNGWLKVMPEALLRPLISQTGTIKKPGQSPLVMLSLALILMAITLSGPAWREAPTPLQQQNDSLVIVLDLSLSMLATDVEPDRLTLAKRKIQDLLKEREGAFTGLVVYAADAHVVTPLTDDNDTVQGLLGVLDPLIMPAAGNRPDLGIALAKSLLEQGAPGAGRILLISDDVQAEHQYAIRDTLAGSNFNLSTIVVGTPEGGPIPLPKRGFIRDNGEVVITQADPDALAWVAERTGGKSHRLTFDSRDLHALDLRAVDSDDWQASERDLSVSRWQDDGYWLLWLAMPLFLVCWRRGALLILVLVVAPMAPSPAMAFGWDDLWSRPDQRAEALIEQDPKQAAEQLDPPDWRGSAQYRAGDYGSAASTFSKSDSPDAAYNRGNALARAGELEAAIASYEQILKTRPAHEDASHNLELVKQLLDQQQQEQQNNQQQSGENSASENSESDQRNPSEESGGQSKPDGEQPTGEGNESDQSQQGGETEAGQGAGESEAEDKPSESVEPQSAASSETERNNPKSETSAPAELKPSPLSQGQERWLRRIPDDPGGLLRRKFLQQYRERDTQPSESDTPW